MNFAGIAIGLMVGAGLVLPQWHQALVQEALAQAEPSTKAGVLVVKATTACFSDMVRVAGYLVPRRVAVVNVEADGYRIIEVGPAEGEQVASGQVLAVWGALGRDNASMNLPTGIAVAPTGPGLADVARPPRDFC
jgi:multidrug efflux pump subunit AcrA (membrane-fusion protein)